MPNRRFHAWTGVAAGATTAYVRAEPGGEVFLPAFGGAIGGYLGGRAPDVFEPATSPRHRKFFHSQALAVAAFATDPWLSEWERLCDEAAERIRDRRRGSDSQEHLYLELLEVLTHIARGIPAGFVAGYLSHLVLDSATPASLPLVGLSQRSR